MMAVGLVLLVVAGCGREGGDPQIITLSGRGILLSDLVFEFDRLHGANQWEVAPEDFKRAFVETYARKELLVERARDLCGETQQREQMILDRWIEKQAVARFWRSDRSAIEVPTRVIDSLAAVMRPERYLRHIICTYEDDAREIYAQARAGGDFREIADEHSERNPNAINYAEVGWVNRPSLDPVIGGVLFGLEKAGDIAEPCETERYGWHVVRLDSLRQIDTELARSRAEEIAPDDYRRSVIVARVAAMSEKYAFELVTENIGPIMRHFRAMYDSLSAAKQADVMLDYQALPPPLHRLGAEEGVLPLVRWSGGTFTVRDFVETLWKVDLDYWPTVGDVPKIGTQIMRRMTRWSFMKEARAAGTLEDPEFRRALERKRDELLLDRFHREYLETYGTSVTDDDVRDFWEANEEHYLSQDLVGYGFIRFGPDMKELAQRTSGELQGGVEWGMAATQARKTDGSVVFESMLDPTNGPPYPELTTLAMDYGPNESGPVYTEPLQAAGGDWVILRVYFRSHPDALSFEQAADFVKRDLQRLAMEDSLLAMLDDLKESCGLEINWKAIR
jgi:hypothetical protein